MQDKVKKAARLRILVVILFVLLAGLLWASINANEAKTKANIALANYYISLQDYGSADKYITDHSFFRLINFSSRDSLKKLKTQIDIDSTKKKTFFSLMNQADTLTKAALASSATADSLLFIATSKTDGDQLLNVIGGEKLIKARQLYDSAFGSGYEINDLIGSKIKTNLATIEDTTAHFFKQYIDATYVLLQTGQEEKAKSALTQAQTLFDFARTFGIDLHSQDIPYLDTLHKILHK
ncbi:MAG: hypothetical protein ICV51_18230 [Flavisolibacter sp.]|nr:hypothetical protein [Flavisolibacter sp.]MBD0377552.1 hypothetical protein [Flavisolibacter sp.]